MMQDYAFPFSAIVGQEKVKTALLLNLVNPRIGGVLISGQKGTAKSTIVRGLARLLPKTTLVELPLNVTEDRLIGTIDLEKAVSSGRRYFEPGILAKANGNILYVDEVNLLSEYIVNSLLDVAQSGVNVVEREGISHSHQAEFILVGTMNPEEGILNPQFLDRFGLYVEVKGEDGLDERKEVVARCLEYERAPELFIQRYKERDEEVGSKIASAQKLLVQVEVSDSIVKTVAGTAKQFYCQGHRADLVMVETSRTIAALNERRNITVEDIKKAAELALPHRISKSLHDQNLAQENETEEQDSQHEKEDNQEPPQDRGHSMPGEAASPQPEIERGEQKETFEPGGYSDRQRDQPSPVSEEEVEEPGEVFRINSIRLESSERRLREGSGKRSRTRTSSRQGRYIRYKLPGETLQDLAFDATLRAAAVSRRGKRNDSTLVIEKADYREKVREKRIGNTLLFVVDASGSMGAGQRMKATKTAVLSLLNDAYQKRDMVGLIAFKHRTAEPLLGITRSIQLADRSLKDLPTGGRTPLSAGLVLGYKMLKARKVKDPDMVPVLVLVSDGRANVSALGGDPVEEAKEIAKKIRAEGINSLIIDSEKNYIELGLAKELAEVMGAQYFKLQELKAQEIEGAVRSFLQLTDII